MANIVSAACALRRLSLFVLIMLLSAAAFAAAAPPVRPLIVVFPTGDAGVSTLEVTKNDDTASLNRPLIAARAVRDMLNDSGVVAAALYNADGSMYKRAALEAKIQLITPNDPTQIERTALGKAVGAVYVVAVSAQAATNSATGVEITIQGVDIESGKVYTDKSGSVSGSALKPPAGSKDGNAVQHTETTVVTGMSAENAMRSAANTVVIRLLAGPLAEFSRPAAPPGLLPQTPATPVTPDVSGPQAALPPAIPVNPAAPGARKAADATSPASGPATVPGTPAAPPTAGTPNPDDPAVRASDILATNRQADMMLSAGDTNSAIVMLRKAINQSPDAMSLRTVLARSYLAGNRPGNAATEAERALALNAGTDRAAELELTKVLTDAFAQVGDVQAARNSYEEIIRTQPESAGWARVALANLFIDDSQPEKAEPLLHAVRSAEPANRGAVVALARLLADKGDFAAVSSEFAAFTAAAGKRAGSETVTAFFDQRIQRIGDAAASNRSSYEKGTLARPAIFTAVNAQIGRVASLTALLKSAAPPEGSPENEVRAYKRRLYAASLLGDSLAALATFLDVGDADAGSRASVQLIEFQREMDEARQTSSPVPSISPAP